MQRYDDQRPRRLSEFCTSLFVKRLPESLEAPSRPDEISQTERASWSREIGFRQIRRCGIQRLLVFAVVGLLVLLGFMQVMSSFGATIDAFFPDEVDWLFSHIIQLEPYDGRLSQLPKGRMSGVDPVTCLSHNDEWRRAPLYDALAAGCRSVEADVWFFEGEIYVGHSPSELTPDRTLRSVYLDPLLELVQKANHQQENESFHGQTTDLRGLFPADPAQSLVFLVDVKTAKEELWWHLERLLEPLRAANYLTHYNGTAVLNGPVTIVASGRASFEMVVANETYRDIFYDAPLDRLTDKYFFSDDPKYFEEKVIQPSDKLLSSESAMSDTSKSEQYRIPNSYFASTSFLHSIGPIWGSRLTQDQLQRVRSHVRGAHERGLKARYWETPLWPVGLRNHIWRVLIHEGVDILVVDDLSAVARSL